ncbi:MAG TPA: hypothetical protein DC017_15815 [Candidatus Wallbacteria bacterium]|nr:hypothetical protein [Candidatus Wallbacteria bacterium]
MANRSRRLYRRSCEKDRRREKFSQNQKDGRDKSKARIENKRSREKGNKLIRFLSVIVFHNKNPSD